jgi:hypothetical protein
MTDPRTAAEPAADNYLADDGAFDLDRYQAENRREPYRFNWAGQRWELPNVYDLPFSILDLVGGDEDNLPVEKVVDGLKSAFGPEQWHQINDRRPLPIMSTIELFNRWLAFCGVDRGEAASFADSSADTAKPLKRTSPSTTKGSTSAKRSTAGRKNAARRVASSR